MKETWTASDFIESLTPGNRFSIKVVFLATLSMFPSGITYFINFQVASSLQCQWELTSSELTLITVVFLVGEGVGSWYWGRMADIYGRKMILIMATVFTIYFTLMSAASPSFFFYLILRFFIGTLFNVLMVICIVYNTEYTTSADHGLSILWLNVFYLFGNLYGIAVSYGTLNRYDWRTYMVVVMLPCVILVPPMLWLPESIRFLQVQKKTKDILNILDDISRTNKQPWPENAQLRATSTTSTTYHSQGYVKVVTSHWKKLLGLCLLGVPMFISYYGLPFLINFKLQHKNTCKVLESDALIPSCLPLTDTEIMGSLYVNLGLLPGTFIGYFLAEKIGRKPLMAFNAVVLAMTYCSQLLCLPSGVTYFLLFFSSGIALSACCFIFLYAAELFPTNTRATGTGIAATVWKIASLIAPILFQQLIYTHYTFVLVLMAVSSMFGLLGLLLLPETLHKKLK
ncbi:putative transporter svop-1 [Clytia hemisphaerica]|uniref:putative transporter svop-1 n=1 Tax=Clytia hemisphaerica TaxID=252671 RepID=UPI0034D3DEDA